MIDLLERSNQAPLLANHPTLLDLRILAVSSIVRSGWVQIQSDTSVTYQQYQRQAGPAASTLVVYKSDQGGLFVQPYYGHFDQHSGGKNQQTQPE
jgi:hypothetical protein